MTDEELIARLRDAPADGLGTENLCIAAADRIEALVKERDRRTEMHECAMSERDDATLYADEQKTRAERLEAAASSVADDVCSYICPSVGRVGEPILHDPRCIALRAALKGADHV